MKKAIVFWFLICFNEFLFGQTSELNVLHALCQRGIKGGSIKIFSVTGKNVYAIPELGVNGVDPLAHEVEDGDHWRINCPICTRRVHKGGLIGWREKATPSLHPTQYKSPYWVVYYQIHIDRWDASIKSLRSLFLHFWGEIVAEKIFGRKQNQEAIQRMLDRNDKRLGIQSCQQVTIPNIPSS